MVVVWLWCGHGMVRVWLWCGCGVVVVWSWCGCGVVIVSFCRGMVSMVGVVRVVGVVEVVGGDCPVITPVHSKGVALPQ